MGVGVRGGGAAGEGVAVGSAVGVSAAVGEGEGAERPHPANMTAASANMPNQRRGRTPRSLRQTYPPQFAQRRHFGFVHPLHTVAQGALGDADVFHQFL